MRLLRNFHYSLTHAFKEVDSRNHANKWGAFRKAIRVGAAGQPREMNMSTTEEYLVGGWTPFHALTPEDKEIFSIALAGFVGVTYKPQAVATQIVAGENYRYKCASSIPPSDVIWESVVEIFQPLKGKPHITSITRI